MAISEVTMLNWTLGNLTASLDEAKANYNEALDTIWMLLAALLVFFMHAGFSLLEAGCVRFKNTQNILAKNLMVVTVGFLCWWVTGWAFAYGAAGDDPNQFIGGKNFFAMGFLDDKTLFRQWFFQGAFCATAGTIVSGAMAERTKLAGFAIYIIFMTAFLYPVIVYWGWSGAGFLYHETGSIIGPAYMDFAGSGLVHMVGGVGALCGAVIVGPRYKRWESEEDFAAHSIPFCVLGTFCLWFGWYGFNPGSTLAMNTADSAYTAGIVAVNTTLSPCVAGLLVFALRATVCPPKLLDVGGFCNGILAGLVAITAGCAAMKTWEALLTGLIGGLVYQGASMLMQKLRVDDVVDAFAVHGATGFWGVFALGLFGENGVFYGGDQLGVQIVGLLLIAVWVAVLSLLTLFPLKLAGLLRLSDDFQEQGADVVEHSPSKAYGQQDGGNEEPVKV
uniref:Ammonium transporter n=1 Tax=Pyrodinium bahamense TaxID=73915 RepID=A0A7S0B5C1_9DINO